PPSRITGCPSAFGSTIRSFRRLAANAGTLSSRFQSGYFAQALKWNRAIARPRSRLTKIGPKSRVQPRSVGKRRNSMRAASTPHLVRMRRACASWAAELTRMRTSSPGASLRTISAYTHGMRANFPGQSLLLWGQPIQVAACGSHSAGMRKRSAISRQRSEERLRVDEPAFDAAVRVGAAVAQERPAAADLLHAREVHLRDQQRFPVCRPLHHHHTERIGQEGVSPELEARA